MAMQRYSLFVALVAISTVATGGAWAGGEKIPPDKLPKNVVDAVKAKFPKAELKHATKEQIDGKLVYEVGINIGKDHKHAVVTAEGVLFEIHQDIDAKDVPEKVARVVQAKYPKLPWEGVEEITDVNGKVKAYEVSVALGEGRVMEVVVDLDGKIRKETKVEPPKDGK
jgi:uncharacterized membrane protein YkoI